MNENNKTKKVLVPVDMVDIETVLFDNLHMYGISSLHNIVKQDPYNNETTYSDKAITVLSMIDEIPEEISDKLVLLELPEEYDVIITCDQGTPDRVIIGKDLRCVNLYNRTSDYKLEQEEFDKMKEFISPISFIKEPKINIDEDDIEYE